MKVAAVLILLAIPAAGLRQGPAALSTDERAMTSFIDAHNGEGLALLERVVNINSGTKNLAGVRAGRRVFRAELDALGFKTEWVDGAAWQRAGHLVADHPGTGPGILLIGHLDTVFEHDSPFQKFARIDANTARGPGVIDMKGGDVIIVQALKALDAAGLLNDDECHRRHDRRRGGHRAGRSAARANRSWPRQRALTWRSASRTATAILRTRSWRGGARRHGS